jgi:nitroreductase
MRTDRSIGNGEPTADEVLRTTRAVRRRLDLERPVDHALIEACVEVAMQAPTGSNMAGWHFVVVDDSAQRAALGELYRRAWEDYRKLPIAAGNIRTGDPAKDATQQRVMASAEYLAENIDRVPVHVVPCIDGRFDRAPSWISVPMLSSIIPAVWSFMLAGRARGLGSSFTTMHLRFEEEAAEILGIPYESVTQVALLPVGHTIGDDFKPVPRPPAASIIHRNRW